MYNHFRPKPGRYGTHPQFLTVQPTPTLTANNTTIFKIPSPYRRCVFVRGAVSVTQVPVDGDGTILGTFRKYDASADAAVTLTGNIDLETLVTREVSYADPSSSATLSTQIATPTFTDNGTKVYRIPTPYRKCRFVQGTVSATQLPISNGGTVLGYFKKYDCSADHLKEIGTIQVSATPEKFKTTTTAYYQIARNRRTKTATDDLTFSQNYTINAAEDSGQFWGAFLIQIDTDGNISTKAVSLDQAYATEAAAVAALPAPDSGNVVLGWIALRTNIDAKWTANSDDMDDGGGGDIATYEGYDNTAGTIQAVTLTGSVNLEGLVTREASRLQLTGSLGDGLVDVGDCLEFHVVCSSTMDQQATQLNIQAEVLVLE